MRFRLFLWLVLLVLLSACGPAATVPAVTLRYALWDPNQVVAIEAIAAAFTRANPGITVSVELTPYQQYWTKLATAARDGSGPDVFWMNGPNLATYATGGALLPLDERIAADTLDLDVYPAWLVELYSVAGVRYALPKDVDTIGLWYNKALFDAAGVPYPDASWDWARLRETAEQLTDPEQGVWGIAAPLVSQSGYYNTIYQSGGFVISADGTRSGYDQPETVAGLRFWTDLIAAGLSPSHAQLVDTPAATLFQSGRVAMLYDGSWQQRPFAENAYTRAVVDVAPLPRGARAAVIAHGLGHAIAARTAHPDEAWAFVKFLGSREAAEIQARTGTVIPAYRGAAELWVQSNPNFQLQVFVDALDHAVPLPVAADAPTWWALERTYLAKAWAGELSVEAAAEQLAREMNRVLAGGAP